MPNPPSITLDLSRLLWRRWGSRRPTGIDRACLAYLEHYRHDYAAVLQRGGLTTVLDHAASRSIADLLLDPQGDFKRAAALLLSRSLMTPLRRRADGRPYINVGHTGLDLPGHARWVRRNRVAAVYYVHDLIPITHPQYCREGERERHIVRMEAVLALARGVIVNSRDTLNALTDFAGERGLAMPDTLVAPLAISIDSAPPAPPPIAGAYFLMVGTIEGRKNHSLILDVWRRLAATLETVPKLVIVGARGWSADEVHAALDSDPAIRDAVIEYGDCDDATLAGLIGGATALLFPSFVEGQGLPLIEALAAGTPVIASDLPVFTEFAGDIPVYLDPSDLAGWTSQIEAFAAWGNDGDTSRPSVPEFVAPDWKSHFLRVDSWIAGLRP